MRVYNKLVIDMSTMEVLEEDSFEYDGPVALCGGGGSSSGEIIYPPHMTAKHTAWLNSVDFQMTLAMGRAPYSEAGNQPFNPATRTAAMYNRWYYYFNAVEDMFNYGPPITPDAELINDMISAFTVRLNSEVNTVVYPRLEAGMLNINSVQSSAFVMGRATIESKRLEVLSDYAAKITTDITVAHENISMQHELSARDHLKSMTHLGIELERLGIIADSERQTRLADQDALDALWDLECFKYGCNVMSSIGSASVHTGQKSVSPGQSAMGGAMSGAAAGLMYGSQAGSAIGPGYGTAIGAVIGGIAGYLMG